MYRVYHARLYASQYRSLLSKIPLFITRTNLKSLRNFSSNKKKVTNGPALPLSGLRVVELEGLAAAPFCGMVLSDFGAEVIRVDKPTTPHYGTTTLSRGKKSVILDLKNNKDREKMLKLVKTADILIEPYRPGVMERLCLGPDDLQSVNPRLIYARLTGWGQDGSLSNTAGHDINYLAVSGALHMFNRLGSRPLPPANILGDFAGGGMSCVVGILLSLIERQSSGKGQVVDAAMTDGSAYLCSFLHGLISRGAYSEVAGSNMLDTASPFYDTYECADGKWMSVGAIEPQFYTLFLKGIGLYQTTENDEKVRLKHNTGKKFNTTDTKDLHSTLRVDNQYDESQWANTKNIIAEKFKSESRQYWTDIFKPDGPFRDACVTPVLSPSEAANHPHNIHRGIYNAGNDRTEGGINHVSRSPRLSRSCPKQEKFSSEPKHGQHQDEVFNNL